MSAESEIMTTSTASQIPSRVESMFGPGVAWKSPSEVSASAWELPAFHLLWSDEVASESEIRRLWDDRKGRQAFSVVLLAAAQNIDNVRVAGPQDTRPVRELPAGRVLDLLHAASDMAPRQAASFLAREFSRLEDAVVPGLKVKDLLTPYFARERLKWPANASRLSGALGKDSADWQHCVAVPVPGHGLPGGPASQSRLPAAPRWSPRGRDTCVQQHIAARWPHRTRDSAGGAGAGRLRSVRGAVGHPGGRWPLPAVPAQAACRPGDGAVPGDRHRRAGAGMTGSTSVSSLQSPSKKADG